MKTIGRGPRILQLFVFAAMVTAAMHSLAPAQRPRSEIKPSPYGQESRDLHGEFTGEVIFPIYVSDVERSAAFYRDVLGFKFLGYYDYTDNSYVETWNDSLPPTYAGFKAGDLTFGLHKPAHESQEPFIGSGRYYFRVRDLEKHRQRIQAWGGRPGEIGSSSPLTRFYIADPDGLRIYFAVTKSDAPLDPW